MDRQQLQPQTYLRIIQELSTTIGSLHAEVALQKTQCTELVEYVNELQKELDELRAKNAPIENQRDTDEETDDE